MILTSPSPSYCKRGTEGALRGMVGAGLCACPFHLFLCCSYCLLVLVSYRFVSKIFLLCHPRMLLSPIKTFGDGYGVNKTGFPIKTSGMTKFSFPFVPSCRHVSFIYICLLSFGLGLYSPLTKGVRGLSHKAMPKTQPPVSPFFKGEFFLSPACRGLRGWKRCQLNLPPPAPSRGGHRLMVGAAHPTALCPLLLNPRRRLQICL